MSRFSLFSLRFTLCSAVSAFLLLLFFPFSAAAGEGFSSAAVGGGVGDKAFGCVVVPDDYDRAVREANELYSRLVSLLRSIDSPERYRAAQENIGNVWRLIATLESRYPDLDPAALSNRLFDDAEFMRLGGEFDAEFERLRTGLPDVAAALDSLIEKEMKASMKEEAMGGFEEMMELYEEMVLALERIETPQDAADSYDTLHALALRLKGAEEEYGDLRDEFRLMVEGNEQAHALSERLDAVFARLLADSEMEPVFDALEPLADDGGGDALVPTPEEEKAMEDYRVALEGAVELFRKIRTTADLQTYADELRKLREIDREFETRLAGQRGEQLVESNHLLVPLLGQMGAEQLRIAEDPELRAALSILLEER